MFGRDKQPRPGSGWIDPSAAMVPDMTSLDPELAELPGSMMTGIAFSLATFRTIAAPIPLAPPVTRTTLSLSCKSKSILSQWCRSYKAAIQPIVGAGKERSSARTKKQMLLLLGSGLKQSGLHGILNRRLALP